MNFGRSPAQTKEEMLEWVRTNIFARMGQEWDYRGKDFDPLINLLVGACASEVTSIYEAIEDSDRRVLRQMANLLVPESRHLPSPSHALARVNPTGASYLLPETLQLVCEHNGEEAYFSPVFEQVLLNAKLKIVVSEAGIFQYNVGKRPPKSGGNAKLMTQLLLGFECPKVPDSLQGVGFYFDLEDNSRKSLFLEAVTTGKWRLRNQEVLKKQGFGEEAVPEDMLDTTRSLKRRIESIYKRQFVTIADEKKFEPVETPVQEVLQEWIDYNRIKDENLLKQAEGLFLLQGKYLWLEITLPYPVRVNDLAANFRCSTCIFPVVNRKLHIKDDADTYFDRPALNVIHLFSQKPILGVRRVFNQQTGEDFEYLPLVQFKEGEHPAFTLRYGGVGRLDSYNLWRRYIYLLNVFREEHRLFEVANNIGSKVSLEGFHRLLGERISKGDYETSQNPEQHLYLFLHPGLVARGVRAVAEYWSTLGSKGNGIAAGQPLKANTAVPGIKKEDKTEIYARFVTATGGGKNVPTEPELYQELKDTLLRRGRLLTAEDVKNFCQARLGGMLRGVSIQNGVEMDPRPGFGITRITEVRLKVSDPEDETWKDTCREIEMELAENALSVLPYRVKLED
ncbi:MAG: type VI secretion system baseplate subunit TssF [Lewinellaceae bacterium]|nr:type VI secretion system baseplate subunit TssF [Saprospiraceae bacterium]MCB9339186.1 type VI secretion system baseplate subunit TssF [Lewinellaceae bacterium]